MNENIDRVDIREHKAGFESGINHVTSRFVTQTMLDENLVKMESGVRSHEIKVASYWTGYKAGLNS
jgi:hypothetical protein